MLCLAIGTLAGAAAADGAVPEPVPTPAAPDAAIAARIAHYKQAVLEAAVRADLDAVAARPRTADAAPPPSPGGLSGLLEDLRRNSLELLAPESPDEAPLRPARRLLEAGRAFSAARALQQFDTMPLATRAVPAAWTALYARALLAYGLPEVALALPETPETADTFATARVALADAQFRNGDAPAAQATLERLPATLDEATARDAGALRAEVLMALHRDAEAARVLEAVQPVASPLLTAPPAEVYRALLPQYNLGVALLRAGKPERGRGLLDRIGRIETRDATLRALRDRANLALGWQFLREAQGATARPVLERVALEGPSSNAALLGLGWAALAPPGRAQSGEQAASGPAGDRETPRFVLRLLERRKLINCEDYNRLARAPDALCNAQRRFEQAKVPDDPARLVELALAPWIELQSRDAADPAVREAWTALPYALVQAGARASARPYYEAAIAKLDAELAVLAAQRARLGLLPLVLPAGFGAARAEPATAVAAADLAALWQANGLDRLPDSLALREAATDLLDVRWLQRQVLQLRLPDGNDAALRDLQVDCERELARRADADLAAQETLLRRYLAAAHIGLARLYEPGAAEPAPAD